jgi:hypothetical protein
VNRPGVIAVVEVYGRRLSLAECVLCGHVKPILGRGLCGGCRSACSKDGTLTEYGYTKADRVADYARLRADGLTVTAAAARIGVHRRSATRYEAELRANGGT